MSTKSKNTDGVFRLTDMKVEEVSAVDRPANLQPFLIVKSDSKDPSMDPTIVVPDGKGGFKKADVDAAADKGAANAETDTAAKSDDALALSKSAKETFDTNVSKALEGLTEIAATVKEATVKADSEDALPEDISEKVAEIGESLVETFGKAKAADDMKCSSCKSDLAKGAKFCASCGAAAKSSDAKADDDTKAKVETAAAKKSAETISRVLDAVTKSDTDISKSDIPLEAAAIVKATRSMRADLKKAAEALATQTTRADSLAKELIEMKKSHGGSQASTVDGTTAPAEENVSPWSLDMAETVQSETESASFSDAK